MNLMKEIGMRIKQRNHAKPFSAEYRFVEEINADITRNENEKWRNIINSKDPAKL